VEIFLKPGGLELVFFIKPELTFTFFFYFFFRRLMLLFCFFERVLMEAAIKHPQAPQKIISVTLVEIIIFRGAQWRGCGNRTATAGRERSVVYGVERSAASVKRRGKYKRQPLAFLDLGQSANGAKPDGCAKSATAEKIRGGRQNTAGM
jgi:hypothetical protein